MNQLTPTLFSIFLAVSATGANAEAPAFKNSGKVVPTHLPFSELVVTGGTIYMSGQIGNVPGSLDLAPGGMAGQAKQVMENIKTSLEAHGYSMTNLVKCTVMLEDMGEWAAFNEIYRTYFEAGKYPARSAFGTSGLALGARLEVECLGRV